MMVDFSTELRSARAENERLRAALKPFAYRNEQLEKQWADHPDYQMVFFEITHGDFRRASAALANQQTPSSPQPSAMEPGNMSAGFAKRYREPWS